MALRLAYKRLTDKQKALAVSALTLSEVRRLPLALRRYRRRQAQNNAERRYNLKLHIYGTWQVNRTERYQERHRLAQARWRKRHYEQSLEIMRSMRRRLIKRYGSCGEWAKQLDRWLRNKALNESKLKERLLKYADRLLLESKLPNRNPRRTFKPVPKIRELRLLAKNNGSLDMRFLPSKERASKRRQKGHGKKV